MFDDLQKTWRFCSWTNERTSTSTGTILDKNHGHEEDCSLLEGKLGFLFVAGKLYMRIPAGGWGPMFLRKFENKLQWIIHAATGILN